MVTNVQIEKESVISMHDFQEGRKKENLAH